MFEIIGILAVVLLLVSMPLGLLYFASNYKVMFSSPFIVRRAHVKVVEDKAKSVKEIANAGRLVFVIALFGAFSFSGVDLEVRWIVAGVGALMWIVGEVISRRI